MENRGGQDDKMPRRVWETVEASTREVRVGETERGRDKGGSRKEERGKRERKEEKTEEGEDDGSKESSGRVGNMG